MLSFALWVCLVSSPGVHEPPGPPDHHPVRPQPVYPVPVYPHPYYPVVVQPNHVVVRPFRVDVEVHPRVREPVVIESRVPEETWLVLGVFALSAAVFVGLAARKGDGI